MCVCECVCARAHVCVCVRTRVRAWERERQIERQRERDRERERQREFYVRMSCVDFFLTIEPMWRFFVVVVVDACVYWFDSTYLQPHSLIRQAVFDHSPTTCLVTTLLPSLQPSTGTEIQQPRTKQKTLNNLPLIQRTGNLSLIHIWRCRRS